MMGDIAEFVKENELSPFNRNKTSIKGGQSIFKTADGRAVYNKVISKISQNFCFADTSNVFHLFNFTDNPEEIKRRQDFFRTVSKTENNFLLSLKQPKMLWKPKYDIVIVTEDEDNFLALREAGCPVQYVNTPDDILNVQDCDIIQVLDCENCSPALERLPQTVFLNSIEEVYLERYLEILSGWKDNLLVLDNHEIWPEMRKIVDELKFFLKFFEENKRPVTPEEVELKVEEINEKIYAKMKQITLSGESLVGIFSQKKLPEEIAKMISDEITASGMPEEIFNVAIPITLDENEFAKFIKEQNSNQFANSAESIRRYSKELRQVPEKLQELSNLLIVFDFLSGISKFSNGGFPHIGEDFVINNSRNLFLENAQPISFYLNDVNRCSFLTGANSGGKTTLLEHVLQIISLFQLGLPVSGEISVPIFSEIYYFAKNKGSMSRGAFETLLVQMAGIKPGKKTLILADEMEAVTEPGVAGSIICSTAKFFIGRGCFLIFATHLGQEIHKNLPGGARIDGIEAKGLDDNNELVVDHNPIIGRLANSTPELIVERLAKKLGEEYFIFLHEELSTR